MFTPLHNNPFYIRIPDPAHQAPRSVNRSPAFNPLNNEANLVALHSLAYFKWAVDAGDTKIEGLGAANDVLALSPQQRQVAYQALRNRLHDRDQMSIRPSNHRPTLIDTIYKLFLHMCSFFVDIKLSSSQHTKQEVEEGQKKLKLYALVWKRFASFNYKRSFEEFMNSTYDQADSLLQARLAVFRDRLYLRITAAVSAIFFLLSVIFKPPFYVQLIGGAVCGVSALFIMAKYGKSYFIQERERANLAKRLDTAVLELREQQRMTTPLT